MAGVGISLVDDRPVELLYFLARGIRAEITATARHRMLSVTVDGLQVCGTIIRTVCSGKWPFIRELSFHVLYL